MNPAAIDLEHEIRRFEWKVEAGAEFAITQPVFDAAQLEKFLERIEHVRIPVDRRHLAAGVAAERGVSRERSARGVGAAERHRADAPANEKSKEHAMAEGIAIAREMLDRVRGVVQGVRCRRRSGRSSWRSRCSGLSRRFRDKMPDGTAID